jgi:uncharacterized membrane protein HdeD (DUF308 family)
MTTTNTPEMKTDAAKPMNGGIWSGILLIVLGIAAILLPFFATVVVETWIGLILASAGIGGLVYAIQTRETEEGFVWKLLLSLLYIGTGILLFVYPLTGILTLTLLLGSFLLTEGTFEAILAFRLKPQANWGWVLADGILTFGLGAFIWFMWPVDASWSLGTLVGASVLSSGVSRLLVSLNKPQANNMSPTDNMPPADMPQA